MKNVEEFIMEIESSEALKAELKAVRDTNALADLLKRNDVGATAEEFAKAFKAKNTAYAELSDDEAKAVAGGGWMDWIKYDDDPEPDGGYVSVANADKRN